MYTSVLEWYHDLKKEYFGCFFFFMYQLASCFHQIYGDLLADQKFTAVKCVIVSGFTDMCDTFL